MLIHIPKHIMVIEDNPIIQRQIQDTLIHMGINKVTKCHTAKEAKRIFSDEKCDFILMDINLGKGQDGISLAREILEKQHIPIVFITAHTDDDIFEEILELSPYGFLAKPFIGKDIERSIKMSYNRYAKEEQENIKEKILDDKVYLANNYIYDLTTNLLYKDKNTIFLRGRIALFIKILCQNPYTIITHDILLVQLWEENTSLNSLRTLVYDIRKRLNDFPLVTHSKLGYSILTH